MGAEVIIRKQRIRIMAPDENIAFACRQFVNETLLSDLNQVYEHVFFQSELSGAYLILDKLKIDLGTISVGDFKNQIPGLFEEKLVAELQIQFNSGYVADEHESTDLWPSPAADKQEPPAYRTESQQNIEALISFLQTGRFPWWYLRNNGKSPDELLARLSDGEWLNFFALLVAKIRNEENHDAKKHIIQRLYIHLHESKYEASVIELSSCYTNPELVKDVQALINEQDRLIELFSITKRDFHEQMAIHILRNHDQPDFLKSFLVQLQQGHPLTGEQQTGSLKEQAIPGINEQVLGTIKVEGPSPSSTSKKPVETTESIYVFNSGLVILHPFLPAFFKALGLLDKNNQFISRKAQLKAAVVLFYLQSGKPDYKEWEMPLNKILCGMEVQDLIPDNIEINDTEIEESISLLNSIIEYWTALRGCSMEALQTTFLMREGKITWKENTWLIQVERSGVDILVDRLPWGIGTFKLPWLKDFIFVEW